MQYRINGILLPEGISGGFGQDIDTRFAREIDFLTGALPAQYGYRTAGVVDITTKNGLLDQGLRVSTYGGSNGRFQPSFELNGKKGQLDYYFSGSYLQSNLGIESPTSGNPIHDHTQQEKGFAYLSYLLNPGLRLTGMFGTSIGQFEIPNNPNQTPSYSLNGISNYPSANLNENQREINHYGIIALQGNQENLDYQVAFFQRYSSLNYQPDAIGDLIYTGIAAQIDRTDRTSGLQSDVSYSLNDKHTLRAGLLLSQESVSNQSNSDVFTVDTLGNQTSTTPISIVDNNTKFGEAVGVYVQDEWKITDRFTLNYGARADHVNAYVSEGQISPRINLLYQLNAATSVHAGYAKYFTPPPMELVSPKDLALFQGTSNAASVNTASPVKSERDDYYDMGITHQLTPKIQVGLDAYYKDARHLLDEGQFGSALIYTPFNYAKGHVYGTELTAQYHDHGLSAYFNLAYSVAKATQIESSEYSFSQEELDYIATHSVYLDHDQRITASAGLSYQYRETTYSLDGILGSGLRSGEDNLQKMPTYLQVNLGIMHHFNLPLTGKFDGRFSIINVLNRTYEIRDGSGIGVGAPQWGPQRAWYIGLSKVFS